MPTPFVIPIGDECLVLWPTTSLHVDAEFHRTHHWDPTRQRMMDDAASQLSAVIDLLRSGVALSALAAQPRFGLTLAHYFWAHDWPPVRVSQATSGAWFVYAGHRRFAAAKRAGSTEIPAHATPPVCGHVHR